jgi:hypothetical protein
MPKGRAAASRVGRWLDRRVTTGTRALISSVRKDRDRSPAGEQPAVAVRYQLFDIERLRERERKGDNWWAFALGITGILLPLFPDILNFVSAERVKWSLITSQIGAGAFLFPIIILCADSARRAVLQINSLRLFSLLAAFSCFLTTILCLVSAVSVQDFKATPKLSNGVIRISIYCLAISIVLSATSVIVANRGK